LEFAVEGISHSVGELCAALWSRAASLAWLLTGDRRLAHRIAKRAIVRAVAHWRDRRNPYALDAWFNRTVVAKSLHAQRYRWVLQKIGRRPHPVQQPEVLDPLSRRVWRELNSLRFKMRAALVLSHFVGANASQSADALGTSVAGARSLSARGIELLGERAGSDSIESELAGILRKVAQDAGDRPAELGEFSRRIRAARLIGVVEAAVLVAAIAVGAYAGSASLGREPEPDSAEVVIVNDNRNGPTRLQMEGAPGWCPSGELGEVPDPTVDNRTGVGQTFVVALTKRYEDGLRRYSDSVMLQVGANNGPPLDAWPRLRSVSALRIRYQGHGLTDIALRRSCGTAVARSTWIIVYQDNSGLRLRQLAIYMSQQDGEWSVWGTYEPALIL
jgi:DNA-directed RNA polymerase specialized sigma24 family protein